MKVSKRLAMPPGGRVRLGKIDTDATPGCHDKDDVHNGNFGDRCERCHEGSDWKQIKIGVVTTRQNK